jgi:hypothetical protein
VQLTDAAAKAFDPGFDLDDISRVNRPPEPNPFDASEKGDPSAVLGL